MSLARLSAPISPLFAIRRMQANGVDVMARFILTGMVIMLMASAAIAADDWTTWPPREYLLESLVKSIPGYLKAYHADTGKFNDEPWVYNDQMPIWPLAAAWSIDHPDNPYYHDPEILKVIARGGERWAEEQDDKGCWPLKRKNGDEWGTHRSAFVYSHWLKAYWLVGDALPEASRKIWEDSLLLGLNEMYPAIQKAAVHNLPLREAMNLYIGGVIFNNEDWKQAAMDFMARAVAKADPTGFWTEHSGPTVGYNTAYLWFLGIYYSFSGDAQVLDVLNTASRFHLYTLFPDGSAISCIDERTIYAPAPHKGNPGFTTSPEGRAFLLHQIKPYAEAGRFVDGEYAANMLFFSQTGETAQLPTEQDTSTVSIGNNDAVCRRHKPWHMAFSAYTCEPIRSRWMQDRQNSVDIYHDELGIVLGGGNTKLQPLWSTFTVGDTSLLAHTPGDEKPEFLPEIDLRWYPDAASITYDENAVNLALTYGDVTGSVTSSVTPDGDLQLIYTAPSGKGVEAHIPFMRRAAELITAAGALLPVEDNEFDLSADALGGSFTYGELKVVVPAGARLVWPARQHNPYNKDGSSSINSDKLVLCLPFDNTDTYTITLSYAPTPPFAGIALECRELPHQVSESTHTRAVDDMGAQFLRVQSPDVISCLPNSAWLIPMASSK